MGVKALGVRVLGGATLCRIFERRLEGCVERIAERSAVRQDGRLPGQELLHVYLHRHGMETDENSLFLERDWAG